MYSLTNTKMKINPTFRALIPPLAPEELAQLEANIINDGCRDPLVVWNGTLIDGHNRYAICEKHGIKFETVEMEFADEDAAMDWMDANQLGRRNLTPDQRSLLRGRRYDRTKPTRAQTGAMKGKGADTLAGPITAETLAVEKPVSR